MDIELGKPVVSSDGKRIGTVDRLVVDPGTWELDEFIVHRGFLLSEDRIIERGFVDRIDEDGIVHLGIRAAEAEQLPRFVEERYIVPTSDNLGRMPAMISTGGSDPNTILWRTDFRGHDFQHAPRSLFETPTTSTPTFEVRSNLPFEDVTIDRGTAVDGSDGKKVGMIEDLLYTDGRINGLTVQTGVVAHQILELPIEWVESATQERVRLNISADEARRTAKRKEHVAE